MDIISSVLLHSETYCLNPTLTWRNLWTWIHPCSSGSGLHPENHNCCPQTAKSMREHEPAGPVARMAFWHVFLKSFTTERKSAIRNLCWSSMLWFPMTLSLTQHSGFTFWLRQHTLFVSYIFMPYKIKHMIAYCLIVRVMTIQSWKGTVCWIC